jgi:hypothetical protein
MKPLQLLVFTNPAGVGYKPAYIPRELYEGIRDWMQADTPDGFPTIDKPCDSAFIDMPGMIRADRTICKLTLAGGVTIEIPATDMAELHTDLQAAELDTKITAAPHYVLHGWRHCLALTADMRDELLAKMAEALPGIRATAAAESQAMATTRTELQEAGYLAPDAPKEPYNGSWS